MATSEAGTVAPTFDAFLHQAWADHAAQPERVASRLRTATPAPASPQQLNALIQLVVHVCAEHLGDFEDGRWRLAALRTHQHADASTESALQVALAALHLAETGVADRAGFSLEEMVRSEGSAAAICLGRHDTERAMRLLNAARECIAATSKASAAAHRPLAIACNSMLWELHDRGARRNVSDTAAMLDVAAACRLHWSHAGTWVEVERADYGLALAHLSAGQPARALGFANRCLEACVANNAPAYEMFFAHEALARTHHAADKPEGLATHVAAAATQFARLDVHDQATCRQALDKLRVLAP